MFWLLATEQKSRRTEGARFACSRFLFVDAAFLDTGFFAAAVVDGNSNVNFSFILQNCVNFDENQHKNRRILAKC